MQLLQKLYRSSYVGETVTTEMRHVGGRWDMSTEFVPNSVINNQISNRAVVIGNGVSRTGFLLQPIAAHKGGVLASGALQTYGCNAVYRDMKPHFLVAGGSDEIIQELLDSGYCDTNIVYASSKTVMSYPGKFYLVPQDVQFNTGAVATYLACFDGHKTIYMLGFDTEHGEFETNIYRGTNAYEAKSNTSAYYVKSLAQIMNLYDDVDFVRVMPSVKAEMPEEWKYITNLRQITYRDFTLEVDL
jgi:hypothetical protein